VLEGPQLGVGQVRHKRLRPKEHAFEYGSYFLFLPMVQMSQRKGQDCAIGWNRLARMSFYDEDHGDGRGPERGGSLAWVREVFEQEGVLGVDGEIWLHCFPRVLGYTFKPVSFWYGHHAKGQLLAVLVEVNNTFGERHCYLLKNPKYGVELKADKVFHVSPFCAVKGEYRFRFMLKEGDSKRGERLASTVVRIEYFDEDGPLLITSVSGALEPLTQSNTQRAFFKYPFMTLGVVFRIHWHALRLWLKKAQFHSKPSPPKEMISSGAKP